MFIFKFLFIEKKIVDIFHLWKLKNMNIWLYIMLSTWNNNKQISV